MTKCGSSQTGRFFFLDRLPDEVEAEVIREVFEILRRRHYSEEQLAVMRERGRALASRPENPSSGDIRPQD